MKNVIKVLSITSLALVMGFALAGCVGDPHPEPPAPPPPAVTPPPVDGGIVLDGAANYTTVEGDTLADIAARRYGGSNMYYFPLIRLANARVVSDPDVIEKGTSLAIPDLQKNLNSPGAKALIKADMLAVAAQYDRQSKPNAAATLRNLAGKL
jgi:hypothetical protein